MSVLKQSSFSFLTGSCLQCFFAVYAGVWYIFCFIEHFLARLEKTLLGLGHRPSSQDLFTASADKERPSCFACPPFATI